MNKIAVIDYGASNLRSVVQALQAVADADDQIIVTRSGHDLAEADRIILPGQGAFKQSMIELAQGDLLPALQRQVIEKGKPYLGICVGMQILATTGEEHGAHPGLGWLPGTVKKLPDSGLKIPHMGWNDIAWQKPHPLFDAMSGSAGRDDFYFAHSYAFYPDDERHVLGVVNYGGAIAAAIGRDNIVGIQAHPEKSQKAGLAFLSRFLRWQT